METLFAPLSFKPVLARVLPGFWLVLFLTLLASCGFQLRGAYRLPEVMAKTYIQSPNRNTELIRHLKRNLKASDIQLTDSKHEATGILQLADEKNSKRVLSVDSRGKAREYELSYEISFELRSIDDRVVYPRQTVKLERDFLFDTQDVLGKGREEATLIEDMQQDMVRLILLRLSRAGIVEEKNPAACQGEECIQETADQ